MKNPKKQNKFSPHKALKWYYESLEDESAVDCLMDCEEGGEKEFEEEIDYNMKELWGDYSFNLSKKRKRDLYGGCGSRP